MDEGGGGDHSNDGFSGSEYLHGEEYNQMCSSSSSATAFTGHPPLSSSSSHHVFGGLFLSSTSFGGGGGGGHDDGGGGVGEKEMMETETFEEDDVHVSSLNLTVIFM